MMKLFRVSAILVLVSLAACSQAPPQITGAPVFEMNPSGRTPLAGVLTFTTDQPARATLTIGDGATDTTLVPQDAFSTEHELMVLGLKPGRHNTIRLSFEGESGAVGEPTTISVQTDPLPDYFPAIEVSISRPARMEPGVTLVPLFRWYEQQVDQDYGAILALDAQGEVIWYFEAPHALDEPRRLANGNLLYQYSDPGGIVEIDMLGRVVRQWHAARFREDPPAGSVPVDVDSFHHDVLLMPSGNLLTLASEVRRFEDYPTSVTDPGAPRAPTNVVGDVLVEIAPDGEIVRDWRLFDILDPYRLGYESLDTGFWYNVYNDVVDEPPVDWHHANGIYYDAASDSALISSYHMSAVYKLDLASGQLEWILGDPTGWRAPWSDLLLEPEGDLLWPYQGHAPELTPQGTLLLYDNGGYRAIPPNPRTTVGEESFSRAVEYRIDQKNGTVSQVWSFGGPGDDWFLSPFISEADWLPQTGNVLVTSGGRVTKVDGSAGLTPFEGHLWITLHEVTHTTPAEKVWEVVIDDPAVSWTSYRAERVPSLYP